MPNRLRFRSDRSAAMELRDQRSSTLRAVVSWIDVARIRVKH
jgi:hypothetical protein